MSDCVSIMLVAGTLACSRVAKVSVCPQALLALREQARAFGQETRHALLKEAGWHGAEDGLESFEEHQDFPTVCIVNTSPPSFTLSIITTASLIK